MKEQKGWPSVTGTDRAGGREDAEVRDLFILSSPLKAMTVLPQPADDGALVTRFLLISLLGLGPLKLSHRVCHSLRRWGSYCHQDKEIEAQRGEVNSQWSQSKENGVRNFV